MATSVPPTLPLLPVRCLGRPWLAIVMLSTSLSTLLAAAADACEVRLGGAIAASGKHQTYGEDLVKGWTLWAETINARGGLRLPSGNCTVHLPLDARDDGSSASASAALLEEMLDPASATFANLDFVIGPASSGITKVDAAVAERFQRIIFSSGASESLYNSGNGYIFSVLTPGRQYMVSALQLLYAQGARTVAIAHEAKSFSQSVCQGANETAHALGMTVPVYYEYAPGKKNFADIVFEIKRVQADVYVGCGHIDDVTYLVGNANVLNVNPGALLVTHASDSRIVHTVGAQHSHGLLSPTQWDRSLKFSDDDGFFGSAEDFAQTYTSRFGIAPSYQVAYSAAMGYTLGKAIEAAGSKDTEAVRAALLQLRLNSFYGPIAFSGSDDPSGLLGTMPLRPMVTTQVFNASIRVVAPETAAAADVLYPMPTWSEKTLQLYPCHPGFFDDGVDAHGDVLCTPCPTGEYRDLTLLTCSPCPPGEFAEQAGSAACQKCGATTRSESEEGSTRCVRCPAGTFCPEGMSVPKACPAGSFCLEGEVLPVPCPEGTQLSSEGGSSSEDCEMCAPGRFADVAGTAECEPCKIGRYVAEPGQRKCLESPMGSYQNATGQSSYIVCPASFITHFSGADNAGACVCARNTFLNRRAKVCETCPPGATCPGGSATPLVKEGHYAGLIGNPSLPLSHPEAFSGLLIWTCPPPESRFCPGEDLSASVETGEGFDSRVSLSGVRRPGECPAHHQGVACAMCDDGYWAKNGRCEACESQSKWLIAPVSISIGVIGALATYKFTGHRVSESFTAQLLLTCTVGLAVRFAQLLVVLGTFHPSLPKDIQAIIDTMSLLLLDLRLPVLRLECISGSTFGSKYMMNATMPLVIVAIFFGNWGVSCVLSRATNGRIKALDFDHTCNVCGLIMISLYVGLCKIALSYFECRWHEGAPENDTLIQFPSVICGSEEHSSMAWAGWLAVILYMVGMLVVVIYVSIRAPSLYSRSAAFRCRFRFLVVRWRPDKWYWGVIYMVRDVLILLLGVLVPRSPMVQTSLMFVFLLLAMVLVVSQSPWRDNRTNHVDLMMTVYLCIFIALSYKYIVNDPSLNSEQSGAILSVMMGLLGIVFSAIICTLAYAVFLMQNRRRVEAARKDKISGLADDFVQLGKLLCNVDKEDFTRVCSFFGQADLMDLARVLGLLSQSSRAPSTLSSADDAVLPPSGKSGPLFRLAQAAQSAMGLSRGNSEGSLYQVGAHFDPAGSPRKRLQATESPMGRLSTLRATALEAPGLLGRFSLQTPPRSMKEHRLSKASEKATGLPLDGTDWHRKLPAFVSV